MLLQHSADVMRITILSGRMRARRESELEHFPFGIARSKRSLRSIFEQPIDVVSGDGRGVKVGLGIDADG